jgi:hypothetical protein
MYAGNRQSVGGRQIAVSRRLQVFLIFLLAFTALVSACGDDDLPVASSEDGPASSKSSTDEPAATSAGPIGGGAASGTGTDVELNCPDGVEHDTEEWYGPAGLTRRGAVDEPFGDLIVGWMGQPFEIESTDTWSSWGLNDPGGNLVAVATVVVTSGGWDPSHARYCIMPRPTPPLNTPPFTLYVSNQSINDPTVGITITIDGDVVVAEDFDVEGQHNWITFEPDIDPGDHTLTAVSDTSAELTIEFSIPAGEPRGAVVNYFFHPNDGPPEFAFRITDGPIGFD